MGAAQGAPQAVYRVATEAHDTRIEAVDGQHHLECHSYKDRRGIRGLDVPCLFRSRSRWPGMHFCLWR